MKWGSKWLWGHSCGFLIVEVCFANIPNLSLCFLDLLCHLDLFTEESDSEEDVADDSHRGSSDDLSDETSDTSSCYHFCLGIMDQGWAGFCFFWSFTGLICGMIVVTRLFSLSVIQLVQRGIGCIQICLLEPWLVLMTSAVGCTCCCWLTGAFCCGELC